MADGLLDDNQNAQSSEKEESLPFSLRCGWRTWRPNWLQSFSSPKWFLAAISMFSIVQGILVNGLTGVSIPDIEKEFGLSSSSAGIILASNDIAGIVLVPIISFWGAHGKKPKWLGYGAIITGIGALLFALPKLMTGTHTIPGMGKVNPFCTVGGNSNAACVKSLYGSSSLYLFFLCLGQFVMGAGTTPLFTLGPAYLDENVNPKFSPIYLGLWYATTFFGPGLGFAAGGIFLNMFTDLKVPEGTKLHPRDPRWIGAWWLGYFIFSWFLLLSGVFLLCFPKEMPKFRVKRNEALKEGNILEADEDIGKNLRGLFIATIRLLKNKTFIFIVLAVTVRVLYGSAIGSFFAKIIVLKFGGRTSEIALATGAVLLPGMAGGIIVGSFMIKKLPLKNVAKKATFICAMSSLVTIGGSLGFLLPGCRTTVMAGTTTPYTNSSDIGSLTSKCNTKCVCARSLYFPVCGIDGKSYFSPCHAGCQGAISKTEFIQCSCITGAKLRRRNSNLTNPQIMAMMAKQFQSGSGSFANFSSQFNLTGKPFGNSSIPFKHEAKAGFCDRDCKNLKLFLFCSFILILIVFFSVTPQKIAVLRCVPENQRAYALGIQFLFMRSLSFIPGPVIFGAVIDSQCTVWSKDNCGKRGNCLDYNVEKLSWNIVYLGIVTGAIGTVFYFLAWYFYKPAPTQAADGVMYNAEDGILLEKKEPASSENGNA